MPASISQKASEPSVNGVQKVLGEDKLQPSVTVVIPAYNCSAYLRRCIDSALNQTFSPSECIIVNDGSTDDTRQVAESYGDRLILINQPNQGASAARNTGIEHAKGEFIAFLDADDYWHPTKLEKQVRLAKEHPDVVLICTGLSWHTMNDTDRLQDESIASEPYSMAMAEVHTDLLPLFQDPYLGTPSVMVRTERAREVGGFDVSLPIAEDLDFYFRVCQNHTYARINQPLTIIHVRPGSLSHTQPGYKLNLEVIDRVERTNPEFARLNRGDFNRQRLSIYQNWVARCITMGKGSEARLLLGESRQYGKLPSYNKLFVKSFLARALIAIKRAFSRR